MATRRDCAPVFTLAIGRVSGRHTMVSLLGLIAVVPLLGVRLQEYAAINVSS